MRLRPSRETIVPLLVACALFMENLDSSVIATALPAIARSLGEDPLRLSMAITSYLLSLAIFIPISGWMADRFGGRTVFRAAIAVFTLGSVACGFADSLPQLVAARVLQGAGGAMMVPVGRLVMLRTVPKARLLRAMAYVTIPALIGPVLGPPVGGFIATYASWRWIFFINLPIGILGILLVSRFIHDEPQQDVRPLDVRGFLLTGFALGGIMFGFEALGRGALAPWLLALLIGGGAVCAGLYVLHARRTPHPIVDFSLMRIPTFRASLLGGIFFRVGIGAIPFLMPMMLQLAFGLSAFASGLITFAGAAGAMTMKFTAGPFLRLFGFRRVLVANSIISGLFLISYGLFEIDTPHWVIIAVLLAGGFFRSLQFTALNTLSYADAPPELLSRATSLVSVAQQLSLSLGVGLGAILLHLTRLGRQGTELVVDDFDPAFWAIGGLSFAAALFFVPLAANAGAEVSGHRQRGAPARPAGADD